MPFLRDIVKQWDSALDSSTRATHKELDGQIQELEEPFKVAGKQAMYPGEFGDPSENCNCRCCLLQRARWAISKEEYVTKFNGDDNELVTMESDSYAKFEEEYRQIVSDGLKTGDSGGIIKEKIREDIKSGIYPLKINEGNQNKHIVTSHSYKEDLHKSILYGDLKTAEDIVLTYSGTGDIKLDTKNNWTNKEFIVLDYNIGEVYDNFSSQYIPTNRVGIHYGNKGTHVIPYK